MSNQACKAAACAGKCRGSMVVDEFRELSDVTAMLAANNHLSTEQLDEVIDLYTRYAEEVQRRKEADNRALGALKEILDL